MNESFESSSNILTSATYSAAAVYFGLVAIIAVVVNLSIVTVYLKNKKVSFPFFFINDFLTAGVNFINILFAASTCPDPKCTKRY